MRCLHSFGKSGWAEQDNRTSSLLLNLSQLTGWRDHLVEDREQVTRISPLIATKKFELDGARKISSLRGLGDVETRKATPYSVKGSLKHQRRSVLPVPYPQRMCQFRVAGDRKARLVGVTIPFVRCCRSCNVNHVYRANLAAQDAHGARRQILR